MDQAIALILVFGGVAILLDWYCDKLDGGKK